MIPWRPVEVQNIRMDDTWWMDNEFSPKVETIMLFMASEKGELRFYKEPNLSNVPHTSVDDHSLILI